jgi:hypothetical protein
VDRGFCYPFDIEVWADSGCISLVAAVEVHQEAVEVYHQVAGALVIRQEVVEVPRVQQVAHPQAVEVAGVRLFFLSVLPDVP